MSRIDDVLRRAEGQTAGGPVLPAAVAEGATALKSGLDRYVAERPSARPVSRERPHPAVPQVPADDGAVPEVSAALHGKLVVTPEIPPVSIEQYRRLGATLQQMQAEHGLKSLLISSALPREGKTLTAANLALTLSETYKRRVLLVDADLRRPGVHELFGLPNEGGLADFLRRPDASLKTIQVSATLSLLTAGRTAGSPIGGLSSDRLRAVIADAVSRFDWVLLDTPPVGLITDAQLVARVTDGVLFVVAAGMTPYAVVQHAIAEIGADRIVGTVLNRVAPEALPASDYYGKYYPGAGN